jgi:Fe2+ or Zn2+ uptake regulation protein
MLPQKFSPAITLMALDEAVLAPGEPHATIRTKSPKTRVRFAAALIAQEYCTSDLRNVFAYSRWVARPSPVSDQVRSLFSAENRHLWSIDELHSTVVAELGAADYSTVFRAVSGLEKDGVIHRIDLGDGKVHYELAEGHHEHIRCDSCGRVVEVPGCVLEDASVAVTNSTGFKVTSHQLLFSGVCPDCESARQR